MERLLESFGDSKRTPQLRSEVYPAVNVWEDGESIYLEAELPGVALGDVNIEIHANQLSIRGHRESPETDSPSYHRRERASGEFSRFLTLPVEINADKVEATLNDGVLLLIMPKAAVARARQITVKAN